MRLRALIITYYWPPSGGSGVQRWLKFVKYFRKFGVEPIVYTPLNPERMAEDNSLLKEIPSDIRVIKRKIFEPYYLYKIFTGKKSIKPGFVSDTKSKHSLKERISLFIRSNFFVPDPKCFWIKASVKHLKKVLKEEKIDIIISTGPPHSMHLIAKRLSKDLNIPWIADFRDPWTQMYNFKFMKHTHLVERIHSKLEREVLSNSDCVVVVTQNMKKDFEAFKTKRVEVISNGFDYEDFTAKVRRDTKDKSFGIVYTGLFFEDRNPHLLWAVLGELIRENPEFKEQLKLIIIGQTDQSVLVEIEKNNLKSNLEHTDYLSHREVVDYQLKASLLLLSIGKEPEARSILTGKFFEYLAARRPILAFGPIDSDIAYAIKESESGELFEYEEKERLKNWILERFKEHKSGQLKETSGNIEKYSRENLAHIYTNLIKEIINN